MIATTTRWHAQAQALSAVAMRREAATTLDAEARP